MKRWHHLRGERPLWAVWAAFGVRERAQRYPDGGREASHGLHPSLVHTRSVPARFTDKFLIGHGCISPKNIHELMCKATETVYPPQPNASLCSMRTKMSFPT